MFEAENHTKQGVFRALPQFCCTLTVVKMQKILFVMHCNVFFNRLFENLKDATDAFRQ